MQKRTGELLRAVIFTVGLYCTADPGIATSLLVAVVVHEAGHLLCLYRMGASMPRLRVAGLGLRLDPANPLSYRQEALCALAGPAVNLAASILSAGAPYGEEMAAVQILTGLVNLLPILTLDGGRALEALLSTRVSLSLTHAVCRAVSLLTLWGMMTLCLGLIWCYGTGWQSYFFFLILLLGQLSERRE